MSKSRSVIVLVSTSSVVATTVRPTTSKDTIIATIEIMSADDCCADGIPFCGMFATSVS